MKFNNLPHQKNFGTAYTSKSYDRKYTKNYSVYNASGCTFLARLNNGTGPLVSILLQLIFMLAMFCNFAWLPKIYRYSYDPKFFRYGLFFQSSDPSISSCNLDHHLYHNPLYHQLQLSCAELFSLWIFLL